MLLKNKIPPFPGKKLQKTSEHVIKERKEKLGAYMNKLCQNINIFHEDDIVRFLKKDPGDVQIKTLKEGFDQIQERNQ